MLMFSADQIGFESPYKVPSLLSKDEKAMYYWVAKTHYKNRGQVVEIGPWLGSGTLQICRGLQETGKLWHLHILDRFTWTSHYESRYPELELKDGESFLPLLKSHLKDYGSDMTFHTGDLSHIEDVFPLTEKIEILYVDAPKSWKMLWIVLAHLGPKLMPGAQLVFQDFFHITSRQLIWLLASIPQFELKQIVQVGTAAHFETDGPVPDISKIAPRDFKTLREPELNKIWNSVCRSMPEDRAGEMTVGIALDLIRIGALGRARKLVEESVGQNDKKKNILVQIRRLIRDEDLSQDRALKQVIDWLT